MIMQSLKRPGLAHLQSAATGRPQMALVLGGRASLTPEPTDCRHAGGGEGGAGEAVWEGQTGEVRGRSARSSDVRAPSKAPPEPGAAPVLAGSRDGVNEELLVYGHGFTRRMLAAFVGGGL